jgi:catechol 2,3-dioxygenase-like lactoylglutathione lyase family enzyme
MINNSQVVAFVPTAKPDQARRFYQEILGLRFLEENEFALVFDSNGVMLRIAKLEAFESA